MALLTRSDGWVDWTESYRYEPIDEKKSRLGCPTRRSCSKRQRLQTLASSLGAIVISAAGLWFAAKMVLPQMGVQPALPSTSLTPAGNAVSDLTMESGEPPRVVVINAYKMADSGKSDISSLYPWEHLAEPYRETFMRIAGWPKDIPSGMSFRWAVEDEVVGIGPAVSVIFEEPGIYECSVTAFGHSEERGRFGVPESDSPPSAGEHFNPDDASTTYNFSVAVKYVRREIRTLTDRDREIFFTAVSIMQRVPSAVGRELYGSNYYSKDFFNRMHLYYGARPDCDHWHGGAGFVTAHIGLSLMFEQSLQAINPTIALPYWDFTIEGTEYDWSSFRTSEVFADDWFGAAAPDNFLRIPRKGRFAFVPTMTNASEYSEVYNAFGLLRSPWNTDPAPFLTRSDELWGYKNNRKPSGCKQYRDALMENNWMSLASAMNDGAHGHIHELLGGTWSRFFHDYPEHTTNVVMPFLHDAVPFMKYLWRAGYIACPTFCGNDLSWEECHCTCSQESLRGQSPAEVLESSKVLSIAYFYDMNMTLIEHMGDAEGKAFDVIPGYTKQETDEIYGEMLRVLCTPMKIGSHYEGASTNDMTFWVLHTAFDRLWHLSRLENVSFYDDTWEATSDCYGHNPGDLQPFHGMFMNAPAPATDGDKDIDPPKRYYTNMDLYRNLKPDEMMNPYVYDNFEWSHCEADGVFIRHPPE